MSLISRFSKRLTLDLVVVVSPQAQALKSVLPSGSTFADLEAKLDNSDRAATKKIMRLLKFMRTHVARMGATLTGLPGGAHDGAQAPFASMSLSSSMTFSPDSTATQPKPKAKANGAGKNGDPETLTATVTSDGVELNPNTGAAMDSPAEETEAPADAPADAPAEAPADAPAEAPAEAPTTVLDTPAGDESQTAPEPGKPLLASQ